MTELKKSMMCPSGINFLQVATAPVGAPSIMESNWIIANFFPQC